jgi:DNA modification methylase
MPPKTKKKPATTKSAEGLTTPAQEINAVTAGDLRGSGYNPRQISPEKLAMLNKAMAEFGDLGGIVNNVKTGRLVGGHQRVKNLDPTWPIVKEAATDATGTVAIGYIETPHGRFSYREVDWPEKKEKAANIAANKMGGDWDDDLIAQLLAELYQGGLDMDLVGFDQAELNAILGLHQETELGEEDPEVEPVPNPFVKEGDLWVMGEGGEHRLLVGDSTKREDLDRLLMGERVDCCVTDPPYNVNYEGAAGKIENDNMADAAFQEFLAAVFISMHYALKPGGCFYVWHAEGQNLGHTFSAAVLGTTGLLLKQKLVWVKNSMVLSRADYSWAHEPCLYGWREGAGHYYDGDFTRSTVIDSDIDIKRLDKKQLQDLVNELRMREPTSVIRVDKPTKSIYHPTSKPVRLFERLIQASSRQGEAVLDLFSGSGTTIICCRKTKRRARAVEMGPNYAEASLVRYKDYCGEEPFLLNADGSLTPFSEVKKLRNK